MRKESARQRRLKLFRRFERQTQRNRRKTPHSHKRVRYRDSYQDRFDSILYWRRRKREEYYPFTGRPLRLCQTSSSHQNKSSVLVWGPCTKTELLFWCQREIWHNLNGHPVEEEREIKWRKEVRAIDRSIPFHSAPNATSLLFPTSNGGGAVAVASGSSPVPTSVSSNFLNTFLLRLKLQTFFTPRDGVKISGISTVGQLHLSWDNYIKSPRTWLRIRAQFRMSLREETGHLILHCVPFQGWDTMARR